MCSDMINTTPCGKSNARLQFIRLNQQTISAFNLVADIYESFPRLDNSLRVLTHLSVAFGCFAKDFIVIGEETFFLTEFCLGCTLMVVVCVWVGKDFTYWVGLGGGELLRYWNCWWICLFIFTSFPIT